MKAPYLPARFAAEFLGSTALALLLTSGAVRAETPVFPRSAPPNCAAPPAVVMPNCPAPYSPLPSPTPDPSQPTPRPDQAPPDVQLDAGGMGARPSATVGIAAPNMHGDLLYGSRSVQFGFNRLSGNTGFLGLANTSIVNASVAENNSPLPRDRVSFRYNYFDNSQSVTGIGPNLALTVPGIGGNPPAFFQEVQTRRYDTNLYTFGGEKTFFDGLLSAELRAPVISSLSPSNVLSVGDFAGFTGGTDQSGNRNFATTITPDNTLGQQDTYFGNMTLIFKSLLHTNEATGLFVSGGLGVGFPTAPDTRIRVVDYTGSPGSPLASAQRTRDIEIANDTWSLSPFVAVLCTPTDRFYTQGFAQIEIPLNSSDITYSDRFTIGRGNLLGAPPSLLAAIAAGQSIVPPFTVNTTINEQTLLHLNWGAGYWLLRQPEKTWLTGIAASCEVHYTGTLQKADRVQLPGNGVIFDLNPTDPVAAAQGQLTPPFTPNVGPVVGNPQSMMNIVNLTLGSTFVLADRATVATAFTVPLTNDDNRTFDWEFQLQLNLYFGNR